jgi:NAD(P)-dependent dehydrogenase (short-subunit alcohol dehydrogenase family)
MTFDFSDLKGRVAVITGGTGILGSAICDAMASVGIRLAIISTKKETAENSARQFKALYKVDCIGVEANVLDKPSLIAAKKVINEKFGPIEILINGAGGNSPNATTQIEQLTDIYDLEKSFFGLEMDGFDKVFALNFKGTLLPSMVFATDMVQKQKGVILNISSMNSFRPLTKIPAYSAAKASINNFTQWLSVHLAKSGIRVNAIAPGFFLTNQNRFLLIDEKTSAPTPRGLKIISNTPVGKYGKPEDLQGAALFLLSDLSQFITGIILPVDGGYSAYGGV